MAKARLPLLWTVLALGGLTVSCDRNPARIFSPWEPGNPSHPPAVRIIAPADGSKFHAHEDIRLRVLATPYGSNLGPDEAVSKSYSDPEKWDLRQDPMNAYMVEFLAGTNHLGILTAGAVFASVRSHPGQATPFIAFMMGFPAEEMVWKDAPPGNYALTVRVTNASGLATVSAPVSITVLP